MGLDFGSAELVGEWLSGLTGRLRPRKEISGYLPICNQPKARQEHAYILQAFVVRNDSGCRTYTYQRNSAWNCISDDVAHEFPVWKSLARQIVRQDETPVLALYAAQGSAEDLPNFWLAPETVAGIAAPRESAKQKEAIVPEQTEDVDFWICPNCDEVNPLAAAYCRKCLDLPIGSSTTTAGQEGKSAAAAAETASPDPDQWFCQKCRAANRLPEFRCSSIFFVQS